MKKVTPTKEEIVQVLNAVFYEAPWELESGNLSMGNWTYHQHTVFLSVDGTEMLSVKNGVSMSFPRFDFWAYLAGLELAKHADVRQFYYVGCFGPSNKHFFYKLQARSFKPKDFKEVMVIVTFEQDHTNIEINEPS